MCNCPRNRNPTETCISAVMGFREGNCSIPPSVTADRTRTGPCIGVSFKGQEHGIHQVKGLPEPGGWLGPTPSREGLRVRPRHPNIVLPLSALCPQVRNLLLPHNLHLSSFGHSFSTPTPLFPLSSSRADYPARFAPAQACLVRQLPSP